MDEKLLQVKNIKTYFYTDDGVAKAVDDVSYDLDKGETLGLVGESGCGKSVSALSIMRLIPNPPGKIVGGQILFKGEDLVQKTEKEMQPMILLISQQTIESKDYMIFMLITSCFFSTIRNVMRVRK